MTNNIKRVVKASEIKRIVEFVKVKRTGEVVEIWNDIDRTEKRDQFRIHKVYINQIVQDPKTGLFYVPSVTNVECHMTSENRAFRKYGNIATGIKKDKNDVPVITAEGQMIEETYYVADRFLIVDFDRKVENPQLIPAVIEKGFYWNKKHFNIALESASQSRQAKALYFNGDIAEVEAFRKDMVYGAKFGDENGDVIMAQVESRYGLCLTSSKEVGTDWTYTRVADPSVDYKAVVKMLENSKVVEEEKDLELNPHDGGGTIRPVAALKASYRLGKISTKEYIYFLENFSCMDDLANSVKLQRIWAKVPSAYQVRYAGVKGLLLVYPHDELHGHDVDMVFTESMWKFSPDSVEYPEIPLEIASWSKPSKEEAYLNYQFIQALDITGEQLIGLAKLKLDQVKDDYLTDINKAKKVLGLMSKIGDEDSDDPLVSKLMYTLEADEDMLFDRKVQADLKKLVQKFILRMAYGKIPVPGTFVYIFSDPGVIFGEAPVLQAGEYWNNDNTGIYAGFRSPLIYWSEVCKFNMVKKNQFWFLHDVLIFNIFDDSLPRAGGADTDGDKYFITNVAVIVEAIVGSGKLPMVYDKGKKGGKVKNTRANRLLHFLRCSKPAQIGIITNYATVWTDIALHNGSRNGMFDTNVVTLRVYQGRDIDSVKTGDMVEVDEHLRTEHLPHWTQALRDKNGNVLIGGVKNPSKRSVVYKSTSALGQLFDFINEYYANFMATAQDGKLADRTMKFAGNIDHNLATTLTPVIKKLETNYRQELNAIRLLEDKNVITEDSAKESRNEIFDRYTQIMASLSDDQATVASIAYNACYNRTDNSAKDSLSFVWVTCFNGLLQLLHRNGKNFRLVSVPKNVIGEEVKDVRVWDGLMYINDMLYAKANIADGVYPVQDLNGELFIKVAATLHEYEDQARAKSQYNGQNIISFNIAGFKYLNLSAKAVSEMLEADKEIVIVQENNALSVFVDKTKAKVGVVVNEDRILAGSVTNKICRVVSVGKTEEFSVKQGKVVAKNKLLITVEPITDADPSTVVPTTTTAEDTTVVYDDTMSIDEVHAMAQEYGYMDYEYVEYSNNYNETVVSVDEPISLIPAETVLMDELRLEPEVMKYVNQNTGYWTVQSLDKPKGIANYTVMVINMAPKHGEIVGQVMATATNGNQKSFDIYRDNTLGIVINEDVRDDFKNWALRVMSYECASRRAKR